MLAAAALILACVGLLIMYVGQRRIFYPIPTAPAPVPADGYRDVALRTSDGLTLRAWYRPAAPGRATAIFFHGNGDTLTGSLRATEGLAAAGYGLLLPEYRGYGGNPGHPCEQGLYADAEAGRAFLNAAGVRDERIVSIGYSMGSGPATDLAARRHLHGLILISAFTSLPDAAAAMFPKLPLQYLVLDRYPNLTKLAATALPVLVLHGSSDRTVAVVLGRRLGHARPGITYREFPGVGHELAFQPGTGTAMAAWLAALPDTTSPALPHPAPPR